MKSDINWADQIRELLGDQHYEYFLIEFEKYNGSRERDFVMEFCDRNRKSSIFFAFAWNKTDYGGSNFWHEMNRRFLEKFKDCDYVALSRSQGTLYSLYS